MLGDPVPANANDDNAIRSAAANEKVLIMVCLLRIERGQMRMRLACSIRVPHHFDAVHSVAEPKARISKRRRENLDDPEAECDLRVPWLRSKED